MVASTRLVGGINLCPSPGLHSSPFSFHYLDGKERGAEEGEIWGGSAELEHWRVEGAEAGTPLDKGAAFGMPPLVSSLSSLLCVHLKLQGVSF